MKDLDIAKTKLLKENCALVIVKNKQVMFESSSSGIRDLLTATDRIGRDMAGSAVADKIVGEAAAQIFAYSNVHEVYAVTLSRCGRDVLKKNNIRCEFENLVPRILNAKQTDLCPFEKLVAGSRSPQEAYERLKRRIVSS